MSMEHWLIRAARLHGDRVALDAGGVVLSYAALRDRAAQFAGALRAQGVGAGDRVALCLPGPELIAAVHGCLLSGAVAMPIDPRLPAAERARREALARVVLREPADPGETPGPVATFDLDAPATLMFTSGTTAGPKAVELTCGNWLWNALGSALALGFDPAERWLCPMPLAHVGGLSIALRSAVYGTTVELLQPFAVDAALAALMDAGRRVTLVSLVPTMLTRLLDAGLRAPPTVRRVLLGGGPIADGLLARAAAAAVPVSPSFGMTETGSQIATDGVPLLGAQLRVDEAGELLVRGPSVAAGALGEDGWLHTGDLGRFDGDGRLAIVGRRADTIVTGGENVAPAAVEAVLCEHPAVADAAVLGRPDPEWGEVVVAQVVIAPQVDLINIDELRTFCAARLARFEVPKAFELVDVVPRGPTGKLLRRELQ